MLEVALKGSSGRYVIMAQKSYHIQMIDFVQNLDLRFKNYFPIKHIYNAGLHFQELPKPIISNLFLEYPRELISLAWYVSHIGIEVVQK